MVKVKVARHKKNKSASVFRWNTILPVAAYCKPCWVFLAAVPCHTSNASDTSVTSSRPMPLLTAGFSICGVFHSQPVAKNVAGVSHGTRVSAGFF